MGKLSTHKGILKVIAENDGIFEDLNNEDWFYEWLVGSVHIVVKFEEYSIMLKERGKRDIYSARAIVEGMRWDSLISDSDVEYKINDHCVPFLSRLVMAANPRLAGMFSCRGKKQVDLF